jgi:hypothetical protein
VKSVHRALVKVFIITVIIYQIPGIGFLITTIKQKVQKVIAYIITFVIFTSTRLTRIQKANSIFLFFVYIFCHQLFISLPWLLHRKSSYFLTRQVQEWAKFEWLIGFNRFICKCLKYNIVHSEFAEKYISSHIV